MFVINQFDWFGDMEELKKWDKAIKKACEETEGVKFKGRWSSHQARYHFCYMYKAESYDKLMKVWQKIALDRDYSKLTHSVVEIFAGPFDE